MEINPRSCGLCILAGRDMMSRRSALGVILLKRLKGCVGNLLFVALLFGVFGLSSYFSFKFFVRGKSIPTPDLVGRSLGEARAITSDLGLILEFDVANARNSDTVPAGSVVWQSRREGRLIKRGSQLYVAESLGPLVLEIPDLSGSSARAALGEFSQRNLNVGTLSYIDVPGASGLIATNPPVGTRVKTETPVSILVAAADHPQTYVMPDLIDRPLDSVRVNLGRLGIELATVRFESYPGIPDGTIIRQFPLPGAPVNRNRPISVVASRDSDDLLLH